MALSGSWREVDCCGEGRVLAVTTLTPTIRRGPAYNAPQRTAGQSHRPVAMDRQSRDERTHSRTPKWLPHPHPWDAAFSAKWPANSAKQR